MYITFIWPVTAAFAELPGPSSGSPVFSRLSPRQPFHSGAVFLCPCDHGAIFGVVFFLWSSLPYVQERADDDGHEARQVYGSNQLELAWTVIPELVVVVLFLTTARVIHEVQDARQPPGAIEVTVVGHQFWWEYRYPQYGCVPANELHVPVSDPKQPTPTFLTLLSADTDHSFWVPRLAGKTDLIPNRTTHTWIDPHEPGVYSGQCAQYCGTQHASALRVYVEPRADFDRWVRSEQKAASNDSADTSATEGQRAARGHGVRQLPYRGGRWSARPISTDLTHLMSHTTMWWPRSTSLLAGDAAVEARHFRGQ